jgi:pimeloyl-ACP methyl ester carboxylesterase
MADGAPSVETPSRRPRGRPGTHHLNRLRRTLRTLTTNRIDGRSALAVAVRRWTDPFIPVDHAVAAHAAIPGSRLEIFEDVGHYPHCEAPARFVEVLVRFVTSTAPARVSERRWRQMFQRPPEELGSPSGPQSTGGASR